MAKANVKKADWKQRLAGELMRDKKRTAVLSLLLVVGAILVARQLLKSAPPSKAPAAVATPGVQREAPSQRPGEVEPAEFEQPSKDGRSQAHARQIDWAVHRDIFLPELDLFPPQESVDAGGGMVTTASSAAHKAAKIQAVKGQAHALVLQSTVLCERPMAIINGKVLCIGDWISGFEIVAIRPRACDVKKDDVEVTLEMKE